MKEEGFSIRPGRGKVVDVYDGRKWPVVRCGSVYITPSDSTTKVVQAVLATPSVKEKKRRAVKYTVAVGTSHGHVQAFLKDSDVVLSEYDQCSAEEKCLMLIKKPKESSKKLSKAQSDKNLSMSDTQLYRQFDGTAFNSPYSAHKMKTNASSSKPERTPNMSSEIYSTEPRVRKAAGPAAASAAHKKWPAARQNSTFVPIPELGIYTPEQHVLKNGTYAQHCHLREAQNNSNGTSNGNNNSSSSNNNNRRGNPHANSGGHYAGTTASARSVRGDGSDVESKPYGGNHFKNTAPSSDNNRNNNSSVNSSFDESVSSYGYMPAKGVLRGYDPTSAVGLSAAGKSQYPSGDVYHSCVDISHTYREGGDEEFNTLSSRRSYDPPGYAPIREEEAVERGRVRSPDEPMGRRGERDRRGEGGRGGGYRNNEESTEDSKMDAAARSYSLGDLSAGLTFSLAGQVKSGSVTAVNGGGRGGRGLSSPGLAPKSVRPAPSAASISSNNKEEGSSALRHIRERLQKAVFKSQDRKADNNGNGNKNWNTGKVKTNEPHNEHSKALQSRDAAHTHYQRRTDSNKQPPPPRQKQTQAQHYNDQHRTHQGSYQRQQSLPEGPQMSASSPQHRRDSEDTNSSYKSAQSDTTQQDDRLFPSSNLHTSTAGRINKANKSSNNNNISHSSGSITSTLNNTDSSGNSFATANSTSTLTNSTEVINANNTTNQLPPNREQSSASPTKPKRSLPNVPLTETSERIKRFTEMMRSRMSTGSRNDSSNGSRSGSSAKHTPTRMSTDSACSHTSLSRKSSMETASDSEVFTINNGVGGNPVRGPHGSSSGGNAKHQQQHQQHQQQQHQQSTAWAERLLPNQHPNFQQMKANSQQGQAYTAFNGVVCEDQHHSAQRAQQAHYHRPLTSEDTPLPPGDRSSDSGQTTGTNHSYNGSAMDSGYTTNNDADNDSFNQHHYQHPHHPQNPEGLQHHQQYHPPQDTSRHQPQHPPHPLYNQSQQPQKFVPPSHHPLPQQQQHSFDKSQNLRSVNKPEPLDDYYQSQTKRGSNLTNAHRFGSVQNVSSVQAHGNPRDASLLPLSESTPNKPRQHTSHAQRPVAGPHSAREYSTSQKAQGSNNGAIEGHHIQNPRHQPSGRRSWDYSDNRLDYEQAMEANCDEPRLRKYDRNAERYKSTEVISSSKPLFTDANYVNTDHIHPHVYPNKNSNIISNNNTKMAPSLQEQSQILSERFRTLHLNNGNDHHLNPLSQPYSNGGLPNSSSPSTSHPNTETLSQGSRNNNINNNNNSSSNNNSNNNYQRYNHNHNPHQNSQNRTTGHQDSRGNAYQHTPRQQQYPDRHQLHPPNSQYHPQQNDDSNVNNTNNGVVKLRPVPMSRANRNARGRTLPGGFRFTDAEIAAAGAAGDGSGLGPSSSSLSPASHQSRLAAGQDQQQEVMLFHLTQRFDLCPLLVNLPKHVSLKDLLEVSEFVVEISLVGIPGAGGSPLGGPSSPQGPVASKIGSPGSAFTPVRHSQDFEGGGTGGDGAGGGGEGGRGDAGKMISAKVKVIRFSRVWSEELQRHTSLGRLLEGDIVVEVNGWFCLGADVTYLARVVESCQGAITFTVARPKESEEKRFKGQTAVERVKGLEAEISRLDEIIHAKDEKIREMTSSGGSGSHHGAAITVINGEIPVEGMVIGDDEYVV